MFPATASIPTKTKRTRRDNSQESLNASVATSACNIGPSTEGNGPSLLLNEDVDPSLIVDYYESTSSPSPHSGDKYSELMGYKSTNAPISKADGLKETSMLPGSNTTA